MVSDDVHKTELFSKGGTYILKEIDVISATVYFESHRGWTTFYKSISAGVRISHPNSYEWNYFYDYFYTEKETRRLKLNNIIQNGE